MVAGLDLFGVGLMLRFSKYFYDYDVVEEEAFTQWREEINDDVPGKGDALVAINEYLNWMKSAVEESDDDEDIDAHLPKRPNNDTPSHIRS